MIFTSADKFYLTYPYPTGEIDKKRMKNVLSIHRLYTVVKTFGVDIIATSHTMSTFSMAFVKVLECDSLIVTPVLKLNAGNQKVCKKNLTVVVWCG